MSTPNKYPYPICNYKVKISTEELIARVNERLAIVEEYRKERGYENLDDESFKEFIIKRNERIEKERIEEEERLDEQRKDIEEKLKIKNTKLWTISEITRITEETRLKIKILKENELTEIKRIKEERNQERKKKEDYKAFLKYQEETIKRSEEGHEEIQRELEKYKKELEDRLRRIVWVRR